MKNKLLSLLITLTLIVTFAAPVTGVAGAADDITTVGLASSSNHVIVQSDRVVVASNPMNEEYQIDSDEVVAALSSTNGYEIAFVNEDGNTPESAIPHVRSGYIRCTKNDEVIDIPVTDKGQLIYPTINGFGMADSATGITTYAHSPENGKTGLANVGNKSTPVSAIIAQDSTIPAGKHPRHQFNLNKITLDPGETSATTVPANESFVVESNIYADGDAIVNIRLRTYPICEWHPDGKIYALDQTEFDPKRGDTTTADFVDPAPKGKKHLGNAERGKWHRFVVGYDVNINQVYIYVDGELITTRGSRELTHYVLANAIRYGLGEGTNVSGTVAFSDFVGYEGFYYPEYSVVDMADANTDSLVIDTASKSIKYDSDFITNSSALMTEIADYAPEGSRLVFLDDNKTEVSALGDATMCMIEAEADDVQIYDYYKIEKFFEVTDGEFTTDEDGNVSFSAIAFNSLETDKEITAVMVIYNANGVVKKVISSDTLTVNFATGTETISIEAQALEEGESAKVILIDNWTSRIVFPGCVYNN